MPEYLVDSCVLIAHLRGHPSTTELLTRLALEGHLGVAAISRTEIIAGMREHERERTLNFLNALICYPLDVALTNLTGSYVRHYCTHSMTLDIPDAMIAATAIRHKLVLLTYNAHHFPMPELHLYTPMPEIGA